MQTQQQIYKLALRKWLVAILMEHLDEVHQLKENYSPELARSEALSLAYELTRGNASERHLSFAIDQAAVELEIEAAQKRLRRAVLRDDQRDFRGKV